ncbi:hypothetical protein [Fibrivirga algicola]|uniref:Uncharacterized protein n=1 Tax=Fibrivirga algicola TaxID=2950420 RepID=A0ABX0QR38_9BACT|nr:hypothetical protein [Fibrivirga algicola]NID13761.1 hypothetical protein [Fibrivirga algicola]
MNPAPCRTFIIAVTPLVREIVLASTKGKPLYVSRDHRQPFNQYASHLFALLDRQHLHYKEVEDRSAGLKELTAQLPVEIPEWQARYGVGTLITPGRELAFNQFVMQTFRQRLRDEIELRMETTASIRKAVELTLLRWGVSEDHYPLDTAMRNYRRHQKQQFPS